MTEFNVNTFNKDGEQIGESPDYDTENISVIDAVIEEIRYRQHCGGLMFAGDTIKIVEILK